MISIVTMEARPLKDYLTPIPKSITMLREKNNFSNDQVVRCQQYLLSLHKNKLSKVENLNLLPFLSFEIDSSIKSQAYILRIHTDKIKISGGDRAALFYASQTLLQIIDYSLSEKTSLPCLIIHDTPDFERRGVS